MAGGGAETDSKHTGGKVEGSAAGVSSSAAAQLFQSYLQAYGGKPTPHALLPPFPGLFSGQQVVYGGLPFGLVPFGLPSGGADMAAGPAAHQQLKPQVVSGEQLRATKDIILQPGMLLQPEERTAPKLHRSTSLPAKRQRPEPAAVSEDAALSEDEQDTTQMLQRDNSLRSGNQSPTEGGQGLGRTQSMSAVVAQRGKGAVEDDREVKRMRRKQSNRESARRSRLRKQAECELLAIKVTDLEKENTTLRIANGHLQEQVKSLLAQTLSSSASRVAVERQPTNHAS